MPQTDFIKLAASHLVAVVLAIGGPILIVWLFVNANQLEGSGGVQTLIGGFVGFAIQFLFQTNTSSATRSQTRNDLLTNTNGHA
jgi:hypothetical protein